MVTKLKNLSLEKTQNLNCDEKNRDKDQNSNCDKNQIVTKLKL